MSHTGRASMAPALSGALVLLPGSMADVAASQAGGDEAVQGDEAREAPGVHHRQEGHLCGRLHCLHAVHELVQSFPKAGKVGTMR